MTNASLKSKNSVWLWGVVAADALAFVAIVVPTSLDQAASLLAGSRIAGASIAPVAVLLLTSLLPSEAKAVLVYWKLSDVLPGHRAFSVYAHEDPRIDVERVRAVVGAFPDSPREQNTLWYRLFKKVEGNVEIAQAHRHFLLFRDLAALSLLLAAVVPVLLYLLSATLRAALFVAAVLGVQYVATAVAARFHGVRLVCNVLALHGVTDSSRMARRRRRKAA